jgi:hypothetical protein
MRIAAGLAAAFTVAALAAVPANAAAPKACNLIVDDAGDASYAGEAPGDDSVDIVGGDFVSNGKKITGVIRLKGFTNPDPQAPFGQVYYVTFTVRGAADTLTLGAGFYPTGVQYTYGYDAEDPTSGVSTSYTLGTATGKQVGNEIRITADIAKFPQAKLLKNGNQVTTLGAEARRIVGQRLVPSQQVGPVRVPLGGVTLPFDDAAGKKYTLGAKSCLTVG